MGRYDGEDYTEEHELRRQVADLKDALRIRMRPDLYAMVLRQNAHFWPQDIPVHPSEAPWDERARRSLFVIEEVLEYMSTDDLGKQLDALCDAVVVLLGTAALQGFHRFSEAMERVVAANMQKMRGATAARPGWNHDLMKPEGWKAPDLSDLVERQPGAYAEAMTKETNVRSIDEATPAEWDAASAAVRNRETTAVPGTEPGFFTPAAVRDGQGHVIGSRYEFRSGGFIETLAQVHPILLECAGLLNRKSLDYGDPDHSKATYHPFGHASYMQMLHTKFLRLRTLTVDSKPGERPNFESARDTVLDLINYAAFYAAWMDEQEAALKQKEKA